MQRLVGGVFALEAEREVLAACATRITAAIRDLGVAIEHFGHLTSAFSAASAEFANEVAQSRDACVAAHVRAARRAR